jgi:hypothetical protein
VIAIGRGASSVRFRQALLLARPTARTIRWVALLGGVFAAQLAVWTAKGHLSEGEGIPLLPLRLAAVLLCLGAAFILDDDAGATVEPAVASLLLRRGLRLMLTLPVVGTAWAAALWSVSRFGSSGQGAGRIATGSLPVAGLTLEAGALLAVTLAAASVGTRSMGHGKGGVAAGPTLLSFVMAALSIASYWRLFVESRADPGWTAAHIRWSVILAAGVTMLVTTSLDPATRSPIPWRGRRRKFPGAAQAPRRPLGVKP